MNGSQDEDSCWVFAFPAYDREEERQREALLALGNGVLSVRSAWLGMQAGEVHYPGTYRAGLYDRQATTVDGREVEFETVINLPNWLALDLRFDSGPPLSIDAVEIESYRHSLDLRAGITSRTVRIRDASGRRTAITEKRLVSMARPRVAVSRLEIMPLDWSGRIEIRWGIDAGVRNRNVERYSPYPDRHLTVEAMGGDDGVIHLLTRTRGAGIRIGQALRFAMFGDDREGSATERHAEMIVSRVTTKPSAARPVAVEAVHALVDSAAAPEGDPQERTTELVSKAPAFPGLEEEHRREWKRLWSTAGLEIEDAEIARPLHLHAFHIMQTSSAHSSECDAGIPARGWHGEAYGGHVFWDEIFVTPFLRLRFPEQARRVLLYRYRRLDAARQAARRAGHAGAMFPWRSASDGREVTPERQFNMLSGRWMPDNTHLQRHVGTAIAYDIWHYFLATGDLEFIAGPGAEMMLEIARFFASRSEFGTRDGRYHIRGVVGPDEYHNAYPGAPEPGLDDNAYTNVMAVWTLRRARDVLECLPREDRQRLLERLAVGRYELDLWEDVSRRMAVAFHSGGIIDQFSGYHRLRELRPSVIPERFAGARADWALEAVGETADAYQVNKQADALTLFHLLPAEEVFGILSELGYAFGPDDLRRTAEYYLRRSTHRSSLSRVVYAGALAAVNLPTSWRFFTEALGTDLHALAGESIEEGVHLGAMGGTLDVLQRHYLGIRPRLDGVAVNPRLPDQLGRVRLRLLVRGIELWAETGPAGVRIASAPGNCSSLRVKTLENVLALGPGNSVTVPARNN